MLRYVTLLLTNTNYKLQTEHIMRTTLFATSLLALAIAAPSVQAHQAGDIIVRAGAITVQTKENTSGVKGDRGAYFD